MPTSITLPLPQTPKASTMSQAAALKRAESYLANIAAKSPKFNIFVSQRNPGKVIEEVKKSALNTDKSMFPYHSYKNFGDLFTNI